MRRTVPGESDRGGLSPAAGLRLIGGLVALVAGCGYTLGARSAPEDEAAEAPRVVVATVAIPANRGVDAGRMTDLLVRRLQAAGARTVDWSRPRSGLPFVACRLDGPPTDAFNANQASTMRVACEITRADETTIVVDARARHAIVTDQQSGIVDESVPASEVAAADAIERVAPAVVERLSSEAQ